MQLNVHSNEWEGKRSKKDNFWDRKPVNNNPFDAHPISETCAKTFLDTDTRSIHEPLKVWTIRL